jgi:carbon storage regulator
MLVLARRVGEEIALDRDIRITVLEARGSVVRIGIAAPKSVRVLRQELFDREAQWETVSLPSPEDSPNSSVSGIVAGLLRIAR